MLFLKWPQVAVFEVANDIKATNRPALTDLIETLGGSGCRA